MGTLGTCPYCGAVTSGATTGGAVTSSAVTNTVDDRAPGSARQVIEALYQQVALIRAMAETSSHQSQEIKLLRETVARLRAAGSAPAGSHSVPAASRGQAIDSADTTAA